MWENVVHNISRPFHSIRNLSKQKRWFNRQPGFCFWGLWWFCILWSTVEIFLWSKHVCIHNIESLNYLLHMHGLLFMPYINRKLQNSWALWCFNCLQSDTQAFNSKYSITLAEFLQKPVQISCGFNASSSE